MASLNSLDYLIHLSQLRWLEWLLTLIAYKYLCRCVFVGTVIYAGKGRCNLSSYVDLFIHELARM